VTEGDQPVPGAGLQAGVLADHLLGVPVERAKRKADTSKPRPTRPNEWWGIDMTKVMIEGFGWVYLVVVLRLAWSSASPQVGRSHPAVDPLWVDMRSST
jgi:hypothetical protein